MCGMKNRPTALCRLRWTVVAIAARSTRSIFGAEERLNGEIV